MLGNTPTNVNLIVKSYEHLNLVIKQDQGTSESSEMKMEDLNENEFLWK